MLTDYDVVHTAAATPSIITHIYNECSSVIVVLQLLTQYYICAYTTTLSHNTVHHRSALHSAATARKEAASTRS
jgi:hypothetical protein